MNNLIIFCTHFLYNYDFHPKCATICSFLSSISWSVHVKSKRFSFEFQPMLRPYKNCNRISKISETKYNTSLLTCPCHRMLCQQYIKITQKIVSINWSNWCRTITNSYTLKNYFELIFHGIDGIGWYGGWVYA